jgi:hypothetical protein
MGHGQLVAFGLVDGDGDVMPSSRDSVTGDTTTSSTLEDITGLTQSLTIADRNHVFTALSSSIEDSQANKDVEIAAVIDTESQSHVRRIGTANDRGMTGVTFRTTSTIAGTKTIKGQWSTSGGTATGDFTQTAFELGVDNNKSIASLYVDVLSESTTSATLEDIDGLTGTITLIREAHIIAIMDAEVENSGSGNVASHAISINSVDSSEIERTISSGTDVGTIVCLACTPTKLPAGTYTITGRWATTGGTLSTPGVHLFAMAMETQPTIVESSTSSVSSVSSSSISSVSSISSSSQSSSSSASASSQSSVSSSSSSSESSVSSSSLSSLSSFSSSSVSSSSLSSSSSVSSSSISSSSSLSSSSVSSSSVSSISSSSVSSLSSNSSSSS